MINLNKIPEIPVIKSKRLRLVPLSEKYREVIFKEFTKEITKYMYPKAAEDIKETDNFINDSLKRHEAKTDYIWAITNMKTDEYLGNCGLHSLQNEKPELGIWLKKSVHGQGYGKEVIVSIIDWVRKSLEIKAVLYPVDKRNIPSKSIPLGLGGKMVKEYKEINMSGFELLLETYEIVL